MVRERESIVEGVYIRGQDLGSSLVSQPIKSHRAGPAERRSPGAHHRGVQKMRTSVKRIHVYRVV